MGSRYESILTQGAVAIQVPKRSQLRFKEEHLFDTDDGRTVYVPDQWQKGELIGKRYLNYHYYGVSRADLGKGIVAIVEVIKKTTPTGRKFTMLDICKESNGTRPTHEMKIVDVLDTEGISVPIKGTDKFISFRPL